VLCGVCLRKANQNNSKPHSAQVGASSTLPNSNIQVHSKRFPPSLIGFHSLRRGRDAQACLWALSRDLGVEFLLRLCEGKTSSYEHEVGEEQAVKMDYNAPESS